MNRKAISTESTASSVVRCAIYTRKSTEEGLEQEFNSLDAQRESAEAYIKSQQHEGWICLPDRYDDGGFTGGNMERPALRRLMADIKAGRIDCVVVYKVDRLSRSLLDFAQLMAKFDKHQIAFVSVTQQFNTTNSMGRLMLNVLLSFAQFERERAHRDHSRASLECRENTPCWTLARGLFHCRFRSSLFPTMNCRARDAELPCGR
jgi:site-specific DNA recombinase